jgi:mRNA interferase HigB
VHITTRQRLNEFAARYSETSSALEHWYREVKRRNFRLFVELRSVFPTADHVGQLTVSNIGGNRACLATAIREWNE